MQQQPPNSTTSHELNDISLSPPHTHSERMSTSSVTAAHRPGPLLIATFGLLRLPVYPQYTRCDRCSCSNNSLYQRPKRPVFAFAVTILQHWLQLSSLEFLTS